jgi:hypothetical protein
MQDFPLMKDVEFEEHFWPDIPHLIIKPDEDTDKSCLISLLKLTEDLHNLFKNHPSIDEDEPWFGWAFERSTGLQSELSLIESATQDAELCSMLDIYVQRVIKYFRDTDAEPGFYVHEEKEAGSDAIFHLVRSDPKKYFHRFIEYLRAVDLEHTVAQSDNIQELKKDLSEDQLTELRKVIGTLNGGEYLPKI